MRHPAYALMQGAIHRQDHPGGEWSPLDADETRRLLQVCAGCTFDHDQDYWWFIPMPGTSIPVGASAFMFLGQTVD